MSRFVTVSWPCIACDRRGQSSAPDRVPPRWRSIPLCGPPRLALCPLCAPTFARELATPTSAEQLAEDLALAAATRDDYFAEPDRWVTEAEQLRVEAELRAAGLQ